MKVEVYSCDGCGQVRLRMVPAAAAGTAAVERRALVCGGEGLERANGGQTHEWTKMSMLGLFTLTEAK